MAMYADAGCAATAPQLFQMFPVVQFERPQDGTLPRAMTWTAGPVWTVMADERHAAASSLPRSKSSGEVPSAQVWMVPAFGPAVDVAASMVVCPQEVTAMDSCGATTGTEDGKEAGQEGRPGRARKRGGKRHAKARKAVAASAAAELAAEARDAAQVEVGDRVISSTEDFPPLPCRACGSKSEVWTDEGSRASDGDEAKRDWATLFQDGAEDEGGVSGWGNSQGIGRAIVLAQNAELCNEVMAAIVPNNANNDAICEWIAADVKALALATPSSSRVVQKLLDTVGGPSRDRVVAELAPHTVELYESQNGNHVLTKIIEVMPCSSLQPVIDEIRRIGFMAVARHRYGCRVLERLIEHCTEREMGRLIDDFAERTEELCRHQYGNFVIQHMLEHGSEQRKAQIVNMMLPYAPQLASHRTASHVVQRALNYASPGGQRAMIQRLLAAPAPHSLAEVAVSRYGSYVLEEVLGMHCPGSKDLLEEVCRRVAPIDANASPFWRRVAERFGFAPAAEETGTDRQTEDSD